MQVNGKIIEILPNNKVRVEIVRVSACGEGCAGCNGCSSQISAIIAENKQGFEINDMICLEMSNKKFFYLSFFVFILPLLSIIISHQILTFFVNDKDIVSILAFLTGIVVFLIFVGFSKKLKIPECSRVEEE